MRLTRAAWDASDAGDVLLHAAGVAGVGARPLTLATCACVRVGLVRVPPHEHRPRRALVALEAWARGASGHTHGLWPAAREASAAATSLHGTDAAGVSLAVTYVFDIDSECAVGAAWKVARAVATAADPALPSGPTWGVALREAQRRMAALVREQIPWRTYAAAL